MKYGKILSLGDPMLVNLFKGNYIIEEKIDGSQLRMWIENDELHFGSKNINYDDSHPVDQMFAPIVLKLKEIFHDLTPSNGVLLTFEYLARPKHNSLTYSRVPKNNVVLLDYWYNGKPNFEQRKRFAKAFGFEEPQWLSTGMSRDGSPHSIQEIEELLNTESMLGGTKIEGIVVKNLEEKIIFAGKSCPCYGKFVREEFKELNRETWGSGKSLEERILEHFPKEPRWEKSIQHLKEEGKLTNTPKDIGLLIKECQRDFVEECRDLILEQLWKEYNHSIIQSFTHGFPEWYKKKLFEESLK